MKILIRKSNYLDLEKIYNLHILCFELNDRWYKNAISNYIDNSIIIEYKNTIIGVLLQGDFKPLVGSETANIDLDILKKSVYGIVMICIHPNYRNKGLANKLITIHLNLNPDKILCLCTRLTNNSAISLYKKIGYTQLAIIKDKYFLPNEDAYFMIYNNN